MREQISSTNSEELLHSSIKAAREGDLSAYEGIVTLFEQRLFAYVLRMIQSREDAEDIVQDVFLKVFKNLDSFDEKQSFKTWIFTITTNTVYDFLRAKRVRKELLLLDDGESGFETSDPSDTYEEIEESLDMEQALAQIKPSYRSILLMYYREDLQQNEIAAILGLPLNTVKTQLSRARAALKAVIISSV